MELRGYGRDAPPPREAVQASGEARYNPVRHS
jgi:hypothetical protein